MVWALRLLLLLNLASVNVEGRRRQRGPKKKRPEQEAYGRVLVTPGGNEILWTAEVAEQAQRKKDVLPGASHTYPDTFLQSFPHYSPDDPRFPHGQCGSELAKLGLVDEAATAFEAAAHFMGQLPDFANLGVAQMQRGLLDESKAAFERALSIDPTNEQVLANLEILEQHWIQQRGKAMPLVSAQQVDGGGEEEVTEEQDKVRYRYRDAGQSLTKLAERGDNPAVIRQRKRNIERSLTQEELDAAPSQTFTVGGSGMRALLSFIGGDDFQQQYWEKFPLLIHTQLSAHDRNNLCSWKTIVEDSKGYIMGGDEDLTRNVNVLRGSFVKKDSENAGKLQKEPELRAALRKGRTLQFLKIQRWTPSLANFLLELWHETARLGNINAYITSPGQMVSLLPHTDFQCSLMIQMQGRKRWKLWKKPGVWLPVRWHQTHGRDNGDEVREETLGEPYMDVVLQPGDVLYVPRGCFHLTSTPPGTENDEDGSSLAGGDVNPSFHLTVGMEALSDDALPTTWEAFFGAGRDFSHEHVVEGYFTALGNLIENNSQFREALPRALLRGDKDGKGVWKSRVREMLHQVPGASVPAKPVSVSVIISASPTNIMYLPSDRHRMLQTADSAYCAE